MHKMDHVSLTEKFMKQHCQPHRRCKSRRHPDRYKFPGSCEPEKEEAGASALVTAERLLAGKKQVGGRSLAKAIVLLSSR